MAQPTIQTSFNSGELAPSLGARVDLAQYHKSAALLRNFFVDYRGGASTRAGTRYIATALGVYPSKVRLIPFQVSSTLSYVLEFGQNYLRFYSQGAQILLAGLPYTITTPYAAADLPLLKFVQNVTSMILCHPSYPPMILTIIAANNWTLSTISFGSTVTAPAGIGGSSTLGAGSWNYSYIVTALDFNNQESPPSAPETLNNLTDIRSNAGSNSVTWSPVAGASSYNVYKVLALDSVSIPSGSSYGFVGNVTGTTFVDATPGIAPDFSQTPPIPQNPFVGGSVQSLTLTGNATYTAVPTVSVAAPGAGGFQATAYASLTANSIAGVNHGAGVSDLVTTGAGNPGITNIPFPNGITIQVTVWSLVSFAAGQSTWAASVWNLLTGGSITSGTTPVGFQSPLGPGTIPNFVRFIPGFGYSFTWNIGALVLIQGGFGYTSAPAVTITGGATATSVLGPVSAGNPSVPGFFQERLVLAAPGSALQTFFMSQPGSFFNFNTTNPIQADDAITASIISGQLNQIKSMITVPNGLIMFTSKAAWLVNGGGGAGPITPANVSANSQAFEGSNDLPPIQINYDILFGQAKGSYIRDLSYNFYVAIYTGADISSISSHLFYGFQINEWAWAEEPFKVVWAVRNDGVLLSLTYLKEQEIVAWAHHDTDGAFASVCSVTEQVPTGLVDAVYVVVQRLVNGAWQQYVERMAERTFPYGMEDAWCVDAGLQSQPFITGAGYLFGSTVAGIVNFISTAPDFTTATAGMVLRIGGGIGTIINVGSPTQITCDMTRPIAAMIPGEPLPFPAAPGTWTVWKQFTTFSGLTHLIGKQVVGLADGAVVGPLTVDGTGTAILPTSASKVTLGLAFTPQLQTLAIDLGEPTIQGKRKKITAVTVRCENTLGLSIGSNFNFIVPMKDLVLGNLGSATNAVVSNLMTGDARTNVDPTWTVPGQYAIAQPVPYPASILGVIPEITVGDGK